MRIFITLREVLERCNDWGKFCTDKGYSVYCVNEGGGDVEIELSEDDIINYGIIKA